ncbi:MAG: M20/M25/M40 family metallo-hydrolase [Promethearchaeia archaeon]
MPVKNQRLKENLELFSFPRLSGTDNEKRAFALLKDKLNKKEVEYYTQPFSFSTFYSRIYPKISLSFCFWLFALFFFAMSPFIFCLQIIIISAVLFSLILLTRRPENINFGKVLDSQNVIVRIPSKGEELKNGETYTDKTEEIFIFAHLDSKSQRLSIRTRIYAFMLWSVSSITITASIILRIFLPQLQFLFYTVGLIFLGINLISVILIVVNRTTNKSPGALDNGSGTVCILEILNHFEETNMQLNNYNISIIFIGAEECGTMGIRHYFKKINSADKNTSYIINIDAVGDNPAYFSNYINHKKNVDLFHQFKRIADKLNLDWKLENASFGVRSDGLFLRKEGFHGFGFGDLKVYKYVHSKKDTVDKVSISVLEKICKFIISAVRILDQRQDKDI